MRYSLLAAASLIVLAFCSSAQAADCGCKDAVRAALAREKVARPLPAMKKKAPAPRPAPHVMARRSAPADCHCRMAAALAPAAMSYGESYDYAGSAPVAGYAYGGGWTVAPQGYVPPLGVPPVPPYDGPADLPPYAPMPYAPMSYAPAPYGAPPAYAEGYGDGYAYGYQTGITVEQGGWIGGVGYERSGGGGCCGGGGGLSLTLSQPDSLNGPSYNSFGQSYGGDYQSAAQVNQWRAQALAPHSNSGSGSGSGSGGH